MQKPSLAMFEVLDTQAFSSILFEAAKGCAVEVKIFSGFINLIIITL